MMAHRILPGYRNISGVVVGAECRALLALRTTERDFLYNAGFHMGKPNGCDLLMAYKEKTMGDE